MESILGNSSSTDQLEITRNPFESPDEEREHCPGLSPSIFYKGCTPGSEKKSSFRWSIDHMSNLVPAEIDEFPIQEYSRNLEQHEEVVLQEKLTEFFSNVVMPSPWIMKKEGSAKKTVTFSPHPPATMYINPECPVDSNISMTSASVDGKSCTVACQTNLTIPMDFDFDKLLAHAFMHTGKDSKPAAEEANPANKEVSMSTLRRKLFDPDDSEEKVTPAKSPASSRNSTRSRSNGSNCSPKTPNWLTSSPVKEFEYDSPLTAEDNVTCSIRHTSFEGCSGASPDISPIKTPLPCRASPTANSLSGDSISLLSVSSIAMPTGMAGDISYRMDPNDGNAESTRAVYDLGMSSVDASVKESTRLPLPMFSCDALEASFSPISSSRMAKPHVLRHNCRAASSKNAAEDFEDFGTSTGEISVKESTAHAFPNMEQLDMSPIRRSQTQSMASMASGRVDEVAIDIEGDDPSDGGPMIVTDLETPPMTDCSSIFRLSLRDTSKYDDEVFSPVSPLPLPKEQRLTSLKSILKRDRPLTPTRHKSSLSQNRSCNGSPAAGRSSRRALATTPQARTPLRCLDSNINILANGRNTPGKVAMKLGKANPMCDQTDVIREANAALDRAQVLQERLVGDGIQATSNESYWSTAQSSARPLTSTTHKGAMQHPPWNVYRPLTMHETSDSGLGAMTSAMSEQSHELSLLATDKQSTNLHTVCNENSMSPVLNFSGLTLLSPHVASSQMPTINRSALPKRQAFIGADGRTTTSVIRPLSPSPRAPPSKIPRSLPSPLRC